MHYLSCRRSVSRSRVCAAFLSLLPSLALAFDAVSFSVARSDSTNVDVNSARLGLHRNWAKRWPVGAGLQISGYWELSIGHWDNRTAPATRTHRSVTDIGLTPTIRLHADDSVPVGPYLEAGIGVHFLSAVSVSTERAFGSSFQFGDQIGFGARFGPKGVIDLGYRYLHLSNAGLKRPNQGMNFQQIRVQIHF